MCVNQYSMLPSKVFVQSGTARVVGKLAVETPTEDDHVASKGYVDTVMGAPGTFVEAAGDTMTGELAMSTNKVTGVGDPTAAQDAATKNYVDTTTMANPLYVAAAGDAMTGELAMGANKVTGVADPTVAQDAATLNYVDTTTTANPIYVAVAGDTMDGDLTFADSTAHIMLNDNGPALAAELYGTGTGRINFDITQAAGRLRIRNSSNAVIFDARE